MTSIQKIRIKRIEVVSTRRPVVPDRVRAIAESMAAIGLKTPITVRQKGKDYELTVGMHRLEAARKLGWRDIDCFVTSDDKIDRRLWSVAENLHRAHLTKLQRAELVTSWNKLMEKRDVVAQDAHPDSRQPHDKGISRAARKLGLTRDEIRRSEKISHISKKAKHAAKETGLDDNQSALLQVAKEPTVQAQVTKVHKLAKPKQAGKGELSPDEIKQLKRLRRTFESAHKFKTAWVAASERVRDSFVKKVLAVLSPSE